MRAGDLRHPIVIEQLTTARDPNTGEFGDPFWQTFARTWAAITPLSSKDLLAAKAAQSEATARFVIRYRQGVVSEMRIIYRDEVYSIEGPPLEDAGSGLEYLTLLVSKGVRDG